MRQTKSLPAPRWSLVRRVLAGCRQSLLGDGPSRHYLCNPCVGAWTHTPPRLSSALAHSFLESTGLTPRKMRSAREIVPAMQRQQGAVFRGCSHSFIFRLLRSLGPQIASTAASSCWAAGPFTPRIARVVTHSGMWHRYVSDLGNWVYPDFPTIFRGFSEFFVGDLMGKALWKLVENAQRFPRRGGRVLCVHGPVSFHRARPCATKWPPRRGLRTGPPASSD